MSELDLTAIKARAEAATTGPWIPRPDMEMSGVPVVGGATLIGDGVVADKIGATDREADGEFIAHAREDVPALVAEVERLRAELADVTGHAAGETRSPASSEESDPEWPQPIGGLLDNLGIRALLLEGDLVSGAVVLLHVQTDDHGSMVKCLHSEGMDWVTRRGLLEVSLQQEAEEIRDINRRALGDDE